MNKSLLFSTIIIVTIISQAQGKETKELTEKDIAKIKSMMGFLGITPDILADPPEVFLNDFFGPAVDNIADNPEARQKFLKFMKTRMGEEKWKNFLYSTATENIELGPVKHRVLRNSIYGRPRLRRKN